MGSCGFPSMAMGQSTLGYLQSQVSQPTAYSTTTAGSFGQHWPGQPMTIAFTPPGLKDGATATMSVHQGKMTYTFDPDGASGPAEPIEVDYDTYMKTMSQAAQPGTEGDAARAELQRWGIDPSALSSPTATTGTYGAATPGATKSVGFAPPGLQEGASATMTVGTDGTITYSFDRDGPAGPAEAVTVDQKTYFDTLTKAKQQGADGDAARATLQSWGIDTETAAGATSTMSFDYAPSGYDSASGATARMSFEDGITYYTFDPDGAAGPAEPVKVTADQYYQTLQEAGQEGEVGDNARSQLRQWGFAQDYVDGLKPAPMPESNDGGSGVFGMIGDGIDSVIDSIF